jgi:hypothetical protein
MQTLAGTAGLEARQAGRQGAQKKAQQSARLLRFYLVAGAVFEPLA